MLMKTASQSNDTPAGPKKQAPAAGPKGGFGMIFHIAVCSPDSVLRSRVERQCLDYYARRDDACIIEQLDSPEALLARDDAGERYELYLIELPSTAAAASLRAAAALRSRGRRSPLAFSGPHAAHAYSAYRVDAMQYFIAACPAGTAGRSAGPGRRAGVRPGHPGGHGVGSAGAALRGHRIPRVYPPCGAFPSRQRRGCAVPVRPGAVCTGGPAAFNG